MFPGRFSSVFEGLVCIALTATIPRVAEAQAPAYLTQWSCPGDPVAIATSLSGNVYVTDFVGNRVRMFTSAGAFVGQWGEPGPGNGQFNNPYGIATDALGNVYVADMNNNRIQKFTSSGTYITQWGTLGTGDGQFNNPVGVAMDGSGNVYVTDHQNHRVQKFNSSGTYLTQWGPPGSPSQFNWPTGIATDIGGSVYVAIPNASLIHKFTNTGVHVMQWTPGGVGVSVATDPTGDVYVASGSYVVRKFTNTGEFLLQWGTMGSGDGQFNTAGGVATDAYGTVYVTDPGNQRVQVFGPGPTSVHAVTWGGLKSRYRGDRTGPAASSQGR